MLCCVFEGGGYFDKEKTKVIGPGRLVVLEGGDSLACCASKEGARFMLMAGKPLKEPVAWRGPIVMNTEAELRAAFEEYGNGTFIKKDRAR